jgi:Protein of unknown function (DUF1826)
MGALSEARPLALSHLEVTELADLARVREPGVTSVRLQRPVPGERLAELGAFVSGHTLDEVCTATWEDATARALSVTRSFPRLLQTLLASDVAELTRAFLRVADVPSCRVALRVITRDACRRFHVDVVALRMLCTYVGPGTLWAAREHVNVAAVDHMSSDIAADNRAIVPDPGRVLSAGPMDVLVLKGTRFPGAGGAGAVHRSPAAGSMERARLVLTIDTGLPHAH